MNNESSSSSAQSREMKSSPVTSSTSSSSTTTTGSRSLIFTAVCLDARFRMKFDQGISLSNASESPGTYYRFDCDLVSNTITRHVLEASSVEFPTINPLQHVYQIYHHFIIVSTYVHIHQK
jgi:hypothetical protein